MPPLPTAVLTGTLSFPSATSAELSTGDGAFLLAIDRPPLGAFDVSDVAAAASFLRNIARKADGDAATILGIPVASPHAALPILAIVRLLA